MKFKFYLIVAPFYLSELVAEACSLTAREGVDVEVDEIKNMEIGEWPK